jgi:hypothetical protein
MSSWSESKKFKYESVRILVFSVLGFIATISVVQPWESRANYSSFLAEEKMRIKTEVVDDFLKTSYLYASSIYKVISNDTDLPKREEAEMYESNYRNYRVNLNRIILYFKIEESATHYSLVQKSNKLRYKLRQIYKNEINVRDWRKIRADFKLANNEIAELALRSIGL